MRWRDCRCEFNSKSALCFPSLETHTKTQAKDKEALQAALLSCTHIIYDITQHISQVEQADWAAQSELPVQSHLRTRMGSLPAEWDREKSVVKGNHWAVL
jgi:hypothetical protein